MKKRFLFLIVLLLGLFTLSFASGCKDNSAKGDGQFEVVILDQDAKELYNGKIVYNTGDKLVDLLIKDEKVKMTGSNGEYGFFIESICGVKASDVGETYYWKLFVDGEASAVGISSVEIKDGLKIKLALTDWTKESY